jgi:hypothetical protein
MDLGARPKKSSISGLSTLPALQDGTTFRPGGGHWPEQRAPTDAITGGDTVAARSVETMRVFKQMPDPRHTKGK